MAVFFDCPFCSYAKKVPDSYYHKKIKCPRCLSTITLGIPQPTALTALPVPEEDLLLQQTAIEVDKSGSMIECPWCFELMDSEEQICPYCRNGINQDSITRKIQAKVSAASQRDCFYWGIMALVCGMGIICGPIALWKGWKFRSALAGESWKQTKWFLQAGLLMGATGTIGSLILISGIL